MKKLKNLFLIILLSSTLLVQGGCYGSFKLTNNLYEWNGGVGDKWVRSLVFFALCVVPVYEFAAAIDAVILNTIEFWTGENPISMKPGEIQDQVVVNKGETYRITATKDRFTILPLTGKNKGKETRLVFTEKNMSWNIERGGKLQVISRLERSGDQFAKVRIFDASGKSVLISTPADPSSLAASLEAFRTGASASR